MVHAPCADMRQNDPLFCLTPRQQERLRNATPVLWVHVPKAGTSFANTLIHHAGICPTWPSCATILPGDSDHTFFSKFPRSTYCPSGFVTDYAPPAGHDSAAKALGHQPGHGFMFMRQPEERLASAFACGWHVKAGESMPAYAKRAHGCAVKMLARRAEGANCLDPRMPSDAEVELAIRRLRAFAFVGLTDEWNDSICLFHAQFGGTCHASEAVNTRPTPSIKRVEGTLSAALIDPYDGRLYAVAQVYAYACMYPHACMHVCMYMIDPYDGGLYAIFAGDLQEPLSYIHAHRSLCTCDRSHRHHNLHTCIHMHTFMHVYMYTYIRRAGDLQEPLSYLRRTARPALPVLRG